MNKIKVYNLQKLIKSTFGKNVITFDKIAIIEGNDGVVAFNKDAKYYTFPETSGEIKMILSTTETEFNYDMYLNPESILTVSIEEILTETEFKQMRLKDFVRSHDDNRESRERFEELLMTISEIGEYSDLYC